MSVQATSWALEESKHGGSELLVLIVIANHAHPDGTGSWPSLNTIARESRMSKRGVQYIIEKLEASGEIQVKRNKVKRGDQWEGYNEYVLPGVVADGFHRKTNNNDQVQTLHVQNQVQPIATKQSLKKTESTDTGLDRSRKEPTQNNGAGDFKTFAIVYTRLTGRHPTRRKGVREAYAKLVGTWGEDRVLRAFEEVWVRSRGGRQRLRDNEFAVMDFLKTEGPEILESMDEEAEKEKVGAGIPELNPDEEY